METLFTSQITEVLTLGGILLVMLSALGLGLLTSLHYIWTNKNKSYDRSFVLTLVMLPVIISVIILLIGNNVARAFSLAGAFSLIRFRSAPGDPDDIAYVFFTLAIGLACGMGYIGYAIVFAIVLILAMTLINSSGFGKSKNSKMTLKITVPEDVDYQGLFDDIFQKNGVTWELQRVKTTEFGTLFELVYVISMSVDINHKTFIDELRCRNSNLTINLMMAPSEKWGA